MTKRLFVLAVLCLSCGKASSMVDAGMPGVTDAGATPMAVCLEDSFSAQFDGGADGGYDFASCRGRTRMGGQAEFVVAGMVTRAGFPRRALGQVKVDLLGASDVVLASTVTDDDGGVYRLAFDAGCSKVDGLLRATSADVDAGFVVTYTVPSAPWALDRDGLELVLFDASTRTLIAQLAGVNLVDESPALAVTVVDCDGKSVEGATLSTGDAGVVRYVGTAGVPVNTLSSTGPTGDGVIFNLPAGPVSVTAMREGTVIGQRTLSLHNNAVTGLVLAP